MSKRRCNMPVLAAGLAGALLLAGESRSWGQQGPAPVVVAPIVRDSVTAERLFVGTIMPRRTTTVGSAVDGRVEEFLVTEGEAVQKDAVLARLRTRTIELEIAAAQADLAYRQSLLQELENGSRPEEILQARAQQASAKAQADYARLNLQRVESLFRQGRAMSQSDLDEAQSAAIAAEQAHLAAQAAHDLAIQGPRSEQIEQARAQMQAQQEAVHRLQDLLEKYEILAPFDGYVVTEHTEVGAWIQSGDPVAEVIELDPVEVHVNVPESFIVYVEPGSPAIVLVDALPGQRFEGVVSRIVPRADLRSRTFPVKIELDNPQQGGTHVLKSGMMTRVALPGATAPTALLVPKDALVLSGNQAQVIRVDPQTIKSAPDGPSNARTAKVQAVPVEQGLSKQGKIQVTDPTGALRPRDFVIIRGNERLRTGQDVVFALPVDQGEVDR